MSSDAQVYLKIGDVARSVGISPSAIRGWEALGLTHPHRTKSRYRLYTNDDVRLLKKARYLRKVRGLAQLPHQARQARFAISIARLTILRSLCQQPEVASAI